MKNGIRPVSATETRVSPLAEASGHGTRSVACTCFIVPPSVFDRFAKDKKLTPEQRQYFIDAGKRESEWRKVRAETAKLVNLSRSVLPTAVSALAAAAPP